jgi:carboxyl-terminal processing protease
MKLSSLTTVLLVFIVLAAFSGGYLLGQSPIAPVEVFGPEAGTPRKVRKSFAPFWEVWQLVHTRYFERPVDDTVLFEGAINGMLAALGDQHTRYLSPADEANAREDMQGEFQGIGAEVELVNGNVSVVSPLDGSPAASAGLRPGDILRRADGIDLSSMSLQDSILLVRGPAGSSVRLTIERNGELFEVDIIRDVIRIASVRGQVLDSGIAYVRLSRFGDNTVAEMEETLSDLLAQNPVGLILDVRRNPGGGLDTVVDVADQFLPEGVVLVEQFGDGSKEIFRSDDDGLAEDIPMVVLIDEGSASASEVLAGAIRDRGRGILIGQTTFGKGTVQAWHSVSNGGGVRITIARWLTPAENWVHQSGLTPDYFVSIPETGIEDDSEDTQLNAAIDYLLKQGQIGSQPENEG